MAMKLFAEVGKLPVETEHSGMMELEVEKPEMTTEEQTKQVVSYSHT